MLEKDLFLDRRSVIVVLHNASAQLGIEDVLNWTEFSAQKILKLGFCSRMLNKIEFTLSVVKAKVKRKRKIGGEKGGIGQDQEKEDEEEEEA